VLCDFILAILHLPYKTEPDFETLFVSTENCSL